MTQAEAATQTNEGEGDGESLPKRFGKYTLLRRLAVGGMAEIFLALQKSVAGFEKLIVVKRVLPDLARDKAFVQMLLQEARIAATLNHPNIAQVYDVGMFDGDYFIAMEHVHGEDLRSIVRQMKVKQERAFPLEHTLAIVLGCCKGLAFAHDQRDLDGNPLDIVHRDVSPQNVLVTFTGDVKLVDFGIAKASTGKEEKPGKLKGKVPYMSPEQAQGRDLDGRSDVFSLGVMMFELCTGRRLFRGKNEEETLRTIVEGKYPRAIEINPNLHPRLDEIIHNALAPDRSSRYAAARDFQADLEAFIRDEQLAVSPLSLGQWMQDLFDDKLARQKQMLQEGRQLAEVLASQSSEDLSLSGTMSLTGVSVIREREPNKTPWLLLLLVLLIAVGGGVATWMLWPKGAPTGPGVISLSSDPPGAAIWLDGNRTAERTPATLSELPIGTYEIRLTSEGLAPHTETVEITEAAPSASVSATLSVPTADAFGAVQVRTTPPGATVLLDGSAHDEVTPTTVPEITPGTEHTVAITLDGYVTVTRTMTLQAGQVETLNLPLEREPLGEHESWLVVHTDPETASVTIDGETYETGSPYEFRRAAEPVRVRVARLGYEAQEREVALEGGQTVEARFDLERIRSGGMRMQMSMVSSDGPPGALTFDARPWCNVSIDGRSVGQTPIVNRSLSAGSHRIRCVHPELGTKNLSVTIESGQTTRRRVSLP